MQPSIFDHFLVLLFGIALPWFSGVRGQEQLKDIVFTKEVRKQFYLSNSLVMCILALFTLGCWLLQKRSLSDLGFRSIQPGWLHWIATILLIVLFLIDLVYSFFFDKDRNTPQKNLDSKVPFLPKEYNELPYYTIMCVSAGVGEEILYRGFMVTYFIDPYEVGFPWIALLLPALLFSLAHYYQGYLAVLKIFLLSVLFALVFIWSSSLILPIIIHFLIDFIGGWVAIVRRKMDLKEGIAETTD
jgi:membrane protease YdiL (CAAX protease family)